ncbi:MAG: hypothetical protein B0D92_05745 [Spirochaeta sp. LUC14_002_19_P3]|nr:MAG: hypothetical protein B0D92_05745 [Spirochaeta sp. LUC14_002_19_P3]
MNMKKSVLLSFIFSGFAALLLTSCPQLPADSDPDIYFFGFTVQINNLPNLHEHLENIRIDVVDQNGRIIHDKIWISRFRRVWNDDGYYEAKKLEEGSIRFIVESPHYPGHKKSEREKVEIKRKNPYLGLKITYDGTVYARDRLIRYENGKIVPEATLDTEIPYWVDYGYASFLYNPSRLCDFLTEGTYVMDGLPDSD